MKKKLPFKNPEKKRIYERNKYRGLRHEWLQKNGPCVKCGSDKDLEIDHIDWRTKVSNRVWSWSEQRRVSELSKCQVLCRPCHKQKTKIDLRERQLGIPKPDTRTISDDLFQRVMRLIDQGMSERVACAAVGMNRGTYSSTKIRKYREEIFRGSQAERSDTVNIVMRGFESLPLSHIALNNKKEQ